MLDWGLGQLSSAPGQDDVILVSPKAKASIFEQGRSKEWQEEAVDAESQAFSTEYFDKLFPQPLAKYTIERVTSDQGLTDIFFDGPAVIYTRHKGLEIVKIQACRWFRRWRQHDAPSRDLLQHNCDTPRR